MHENFIASVNGKRTSQISIYDHGFMYGDAVFDTFRVFGGRPYLAREHLERLKASAAAVGIQLPPSPSELLSQAEKLWQEIGAKDVFVRIIVSRGSAMNGILQPETPTIVVQVSERKFEPLKKTSASISIAPKYSLDGFGRGIKGTNYGLAAQELYLAKQRGFSEIIFRNEHGNVSEGTTSNVFAVFDDRVITPPLSAGALPGITRAIIIRKFGILEANISTEEIQEADEVFLSGTANFITCVERIDHREFEHFETAKRVFDFLEQLK